MRAIKFPRERLKSFNFAIVLTITSNQIKHAWNRSVYSLRADEAVFTVGFINNKAGVWALFERNDKITSFISTDEKLTVCVNSGKFSQHIIFNFPLKFYVFSCPTLE